MPITKIEKINSNSFWCCWEISETVDQLRNKVILSENGEKELKGISHPIKQRERLASRACVKELVKQVGKEYNGITKDEHDKPHLIDLNYHISISHSFDAIDNITINSLLMFLTILTTDAPSTFLTPISFIFLIILSDTRLNNPMADSTTATAPRKINMTLIL